MALDIKTLVFVLGLTYVIQFAVFIHQYRINRTLRGVGCWLLWSGVEVLAFTCMLLRAIPAIQPAAIIAQNGLLVLGVMFFYVGILRILGLHENRRLLLSIYVTYLAGLCYFLFGQDDFNARGVLISFMLALFAFLSARALLVNKTRPIAASANLLAAVCVVHGGHFAFRLVVLLTAPPPADFFAPTLFNGMALLDGIIVGLLWTFGTILLITQRVNAEMKTASEEMELVFNTGPDAAVISRLSDGLIVNINDGFLALTGYRREECIGKTTLDVNAWSNPADREAVVRQLREEGHCKSYEAVFQRKDGSSLYGLLSAVVFKLQDVPHVISVICDITERKQTEAVIQDAQALSNTIIDSIPGAFYLLDEQGRYVRWNTYQREVILGKPEEQMAGLNALDTIHPEDRAFIQAEIANVLQDDKEATVEGRVLLRGGPAFIWMLMTGRRMTIAGRPFLVGIGIDITEQKRAEERRQEGVDLLKKLARLVPGVIYQYRLYPDGHANFPYSSPGMYDIYEVTPEEVREDASVVFGRIHPEDRERVSEAIFESARTLKIFQCELRVVLPKQGLRWRWSQAHPERTEDGGTLWHGIILDITERKREEEVQEKLQAQLSHSQKMESVGRLAGGVAHDSNNLLMGIMGYADLCKDVVGKAGQVSEWLDEITREAQRSANLTRQLLAFARKQAVAPQVIDLNDTVGNMLKMLRRLIGEDIDLVWQPGADLWSVKIDPGQVDQILANLCVNARDAINGTGKITIETENITIDANDCALQAEAVPGSYVRLAVSDDGCGMDPETLKNIFEPFFTTKPVGEGTGLGLSTLYGIVKQNSGFVNVYSEPGSGTTFRIYLPRDTSVSKSATEAATRTESQGGTETILLVEDENAIRFTLRMFLERFGYTVIAAESPAVALRLVAEHRGGIDLMITDVVMPGMSGRELATKLGVDRPAMKILYMSGYTADVIARRGILEDGVQFIGKPIGRDALVQKVREVLG